MHGRAGLPNKRLFLFPWPIKPWQTWPIPGGYLPSDRLACEVESSLQARSKPIQTVPFIGVAFWRLFLEANTRMMVCAVSQFLWDDNLFRLETGVWDRGGFWRVAGLRRSEEMKFQYLVTFTATNQVEG